MKNRYSFLLIILLFALADCKKDNSTTTQIFSASSYPLSLGNWWVYQFTSLGSYPDTFTLRIDSVVTDGPFTKYICNYVGNGAIIPAGYFLKSDTSMSFVQPYGYFTSFPSFHLRFPVETGQYWSGVYPKDSILVVGVSNSCQGAYGENYGPCFSTVEKYNFPHNFLVNEMLLTPKIGLLRQSIDYNSDTSGIHIQQSVNLISYHIQ